VSGTPEAPAPSPKNEHISAAAALLDRQKAGAFPAPSVDQRIDRLSRCIAMLSGHADELCAAMSDDFGWRSRDVSMLADIVAAVGSLKHARSHVRGWMRPERRGVELPLAVLGARAEVRFQPKGVVGIIAPWNFPVFLCFAPLAGVLAAGNRAMVKPSELTPKTSDLLARLVRVNFDEEELAVVLGDAEVGAAFAALPFDHLVFTGGEHVARKVMAEAAKNVTPLTLELGGKSPAIVSRSADMVVAAARIMAGKTMNAGQVCLAPDYVLVPREKAEAFAEACRLAIARQYPKIRDNPDYSAIIDQRHFERLRGLVEDARSKGARVLELNPAREDFSQQPFRKMPPVLVMDVTEDMGLMQEEIFGPLLPIGTYEHIDEAIAFVAARPAPLALYYFGDDEPEMQRTLSLTRSGGVTVNDVIYHLAQNDLPFGGIGPSGMGRYQGRDGFLEFSNRRAVYRQVRSELIARLRAPYGEALRDMLRDRLKN
jgi:coniferyl-aldehyde dehydrogenase